MIGASGVPGFGDDFGIGQKRILRDRFDQRWVGNQVAIAIAPFFQGVDPKALTAAAERYRKLNIWKSTPKIEPKAMEKFQDILVQGNVLENSKRVKFETLVLTEFANKAK